MTTTPLRIGVLVGSTTPPEQVIRSTLGAQSLESALEEWTRQPVEVTLISWLAPATLGGQRLRAVADLRPRLLDRVLQKLGAGSLYQFLNRTPPGRLLNSLGPLDQSRVFWRAIRSDSSSMEALEATDLLIAVDLPAVRTAWAVLRRGKVSGAFYGLGGTRRAFKDRYQH